MIVALSLDLPVPRELSPKPKQKVYLWPKVGNITHSVLTAACLDSNPIIQMSRQRVLSLHNFPKTELK